MKKLVSLVLALTVAMCSVTFPALADALVSYSTDFTTAPDWGDIKASGNGTAEITTIAYGDDESNKALLIKSADAYGQNNGLFEASNSSPIYTNPLEDNIVLTFDLMWPEDLAPTALESLKLRFTDADGGNSYIPGYMLVFRKSSATALRVSGVDVTSDKTSVNVVTELGYITVGQWNRFKIIVSPKEGLATYNLTTNIDKSEDQQSTYTLKDMHMGEYDSNFLYRNNMKSVYDEKGVAASKVNYLSFFTYRDNGGFYLDNLSIYNYFDTVIESSYPAAGADDVKAMDPITLSFNNEIDELELSLNGSEISTDEWIKGDGYTYTYTPDSLDWGTDYRLTGTVTDIYGGECEVDLSYTTSAHPENLVEILGYYNEDEEEITALESGVIETKIRFWQTSGSDYTYIAALYRNNDGKPEMIDITADAVTTTFNKEDRSLYLTVPADFTDGFIRVFAWSDLEVRTPYPKSAFYGNTVIKTTAE